LLEKKKAHHNAYSLVKSLPLFGIKPVCENSMLTISIALEEVKRNLASVFAGSIEFEPFDKCKSKSRKQEYT
jgi:hypothetical protein